MTKIIYSSKDENDTMTYLSQCTKCRRIYIFNSTIPSYSAKDNCPSCEMRNKPKGVILIPKLFNGIILKKLV